MWIRQTGLTVVAVELLPRSDSSPSCLASTVLTTMSLLFRPRQIAMVLANLVENRHAQVRNMMPVDSVDSGQRARCPCSGRRNQGSEARESDVPQLCLVVNLRSAEFLTHGMQLCRGTKPPPCNEDWRFQSGWDRVATIRQMTKLTAMINAVIVTMVTVIRDRTRLSPTPGVNSPRSTT